MSEAFKYGDTCTVLEPVKNYKGKDMVLIPKDAQVTIVSTSSNMAIVMYNKVSHAVRIGNLKKP